MESGTRLGPYEILEQLGAGGMGEVYRARDSRLDRDVAIKVLPELLAADVERLARFEREAKLLAQLNHANIATIHGLEEAAGVRFIAMECVEGQTLAAQLEGGPLPVKLALAIGGRIADALEAAHDKGIIHRDLKPANIMLTADWKVKVLDFGLAKATEAEATALDLSDSPTIAAATQAGVILGTAAYMSPEQARGQQLDKRTDIWSFGCVLYEMLTARPAFAAGTVSDIMAAILKEDPDWSRLPGDTPPSVARLLRRCIAKDAGNRLHDIADARIELEEAIAPVDIPVEVRPRRRLMAIAGTLATAAGALAILVGLNVGGLRNRLIGTDDRSIGSLAVLPFESLSAEPEQEYFVDGMTDALITELSKIEALKVISRTSSMQYKDTPKPLPQIGRELDVEGIVEGSVLRAGDRIRVTATLIDAASDEHLWVQSYDRQIDDVLGLYSEVARAIARELQIAMTPDDETRLTVARSIEPEAYDALLRGRHLVLRGDDDRGLELLRKATELDPEYAAAWAQLADLYQDLAINDPVWLPQARAAVRRALELDPELAAGHEVLGSIAFYHDWDWETARRELERAMVLNPGLANAHQVYGDYLEVLGRWPEAVAEGVRSVEVNPVLADTRMNLGLTYIFAGRFDEALAECESALELDPQGSWVWACIAWANHGLAALEDALAAA